jgi:5-methylcytosine-specific restriction endonuclease McrA
MNNKSLDLKEITLDHYVPKSKNGLGTSDNLVAACRECNERRGNMDAVEWELVLIGMGR